MNEAISEFCVYRIVPDDRLDRIAAVREEAIKEWKTIQEENNRLIAAAREEAIKQWKTFREENNRNFLGLDFTPDFRAAFEQLAQLGWTLPIGMCAPDLVDLSAKPVGEIDAFFVGYYTANDFRELRSVRTELASRSALSRWKVLLEQCFESFESRKYSITIPALFSVIEGVVASAAKPRTKRSVKIRGICDQRSAESTNILTIAMWRSLDLFIEQLFQPAPFDQDRPVLINRHWILHGRDAAAWTAADSLRLFNALQTIDSLLE